MSGTDLRGRLDELTADAVALKESYGTAEMSPEDHERYVKMAAEASDAMSKLGESEGAHGTFERSTAFLKETLQGKNLDPGVQREAEQAEAQASMKAGRPITATQAATQFAKSAPYLDFVKNHGGLSGEISESFRGQSAKFDLNASLLSMSQRDRAAYSALVTTDDLNESAGGAGILEPTRLPMVDEAPLPIPFLADLCTRIPVSGEGWKYARLIARNNNAAFVAESTSTADGLAETVVNGYKPESGLDWDTATGTVENVAHWIPITRQAAADAPQVVTFARNFLVQGLQSAIDNALVNGDDVGPNLRGIMNTVNPYPNIHALAVGGGSRFTAILSAIATIRSSRPGMFAPNAIIINTQDYNSTEFLGAQDANGQWLFGGPAQAPGNLNPWGLRAIVTDEIPAGTQLIGDFRYAMIGDRQRAQIFFADQHKDFFVRNLLVFLAEQRLGFELIAEEAFAVVTA